jgi:hypothetical protein
VVSAADGIADCQHVSVAVTEKGGASLHEMSKLGLDWAKQTFIQSLVLIVFAGEFASERSAGGGAGDVIEVHG